MPDRPATIRDRVGVRDQPTVVRLEESLDQAWIRDSYHLTDELKAHVAVLRQTLGRPTGTGVFVIGPYGSGKSHLLAWLAQQLSDGVLGEAMPAPVALSLLHYSADARLEQVVGDALGLEVGTTDRRAEWDRCLERFPHGLLLLLDELSEFLRSKPDRRALNEDVRFLQFLGELALGRRFFVLAVLQEAVEHAGDLEVPHYRKIRDRFPVRLLLSTTHVRDLVADHLLVKREGYVRDVEALATRQARAVPDPPLDVAAFCAIYPIHPATLELLEEVRDRFSQTRGVVDFITRQLRGDPAVRAEPFLDRRWGSLLTPDAIVDHFRDVLDVQAEFLPLSQQLFPWYERHAAELFELEGRRELAWRLLKLLVLVHLSPAREALSLSEAAGWLRFAVSQVDPEKNRAVVQGVLDTLARRGRWVRAERGSYRLDLADDAPAQLDRLVAAELEELPAPELQLELAADALASARDAGFHPFALARDRWQLRRYLWAHHHRDWSIWLGNGPPDPVEGPALAIRLPWGERQPAPGVFSLWPAPLEPDAASRELTALVRVGGRPLSPEVAALLARRKAERLETFARRVAEAYAQAELVTPTAETVATWSLRTTETVDSWLDRLAHTVLRRTYAAFETYAPHHGPLPEEALRRFAAFAAEHDLCDPCRDEWVVVVRDGYLVPMKLMRRPTGRHVLSGKLEDHELIRLVLGMLSHEPAPGAVYDRLAEPPYGLVEDQVHVLLVFLLLLGELDLVKGGRSWRGLVETLPSPRRYDRIVPGRSLTSDQLRDLERLCRGLQVRPPAQWTVAGQRRAVAGLAAALAVLADRLRPVLARLEGEGELAEAAARLIAWSEVLDRGDDRLAAFERLLGEVGTPERFLALADQLAGLPQRLDRQLAELERFAHLLSQPALAELSEALGPAPGLAEGGALDSWLRRVREAHAGYKRTYRAQHDAWVAQTSAHPVWSWTPPRVARSRHLGLADALRAFDDRRERLRRQRCASLTNLDFQARCACRFDGESGPLDADLRELAATRDRLEATVRSFFASSEVRDRVRQWLEAGVEAPAGVRAYLDGERDWPEVADLPAFDEHLGGIDVVLEVEAGALVEAVAGRTWTPDELVRAVADWARALEAPRLRLSAPPPMEPGAVAAWCAAQALAHGVPLPGALGRPPAEGWDVRPDGVGPQALRRLDDLNLDEETLGRVLAGVVAGDLAADGEVSPPVAAARELVRARAPADPQELARLAALLYGQHRRLRRVAPERWRARLQALADTALDPAPPELLDVLAEERDRTWLLLDCLGLPLLPALRRHLEDLLPAWRLEETGAARVGRTTTTDGFYAGLAGAELDHPFEKLDVVDELLHGRFLELEDLAGVALAELRAACRPLVRRLDPARPLLVFADHGFRLAPDGRSWRHGGPSTLERVVPVLWLAPHAGG